MANDQKDNEIVILWAEGKKKNGSSLKWEILNCSMNVFDLASENISFLRFVHFPF